MNISDLYYDYQSKSGEEFNKMNQFLVAGFHYIIGQYFSNLSFYFVLMISCRNNYSCNFFNDVSNEMFTEWKEWHLQIFTVKEYNNEEINGDHQCNIIFTDSYESFLQPRIHNYSAKHDKNHYYFIFLKTEDHLVFNEMQKIFEYCWQHYLINCVIQIQDANGRILMYTYFPFTEKHCRQVDTVLMNEYNGSSLIHDDLFPKKLTNFYGCPLRAALYDIPPYVCLSNDTNNVTFISGGLEGKLLLELSKKLNFSLEIIVPPNESKYDVILTNGSITGAIKMLHDRTADITVGSNRQSPKRMMVLTASSDFYQTTWGVMTLRAAYSLTSLEILMFPFSKNAWYLLTLMCILAFGIVALLKLKLPKSFVKRLNNLTLDVLLIAMGMPANYKPVFNASRILTVTWIIFSLVLRTIYQALLFHLIRTHVIRNMPKTLKELVAQNFTMIVDPHTFEAIKKLQIFKTTNFIVIRSFTDRVMPLVYLESLQAHKARYMAAALSLIRLDYYIQRTKKENVFKVLPQNIMNIKLCIYFSKSSFLVEQFDDILMMIKGFGIIESWFLQEIKTNFISGTHSDGNKTFGLNELKMAFVLLLLGHIMAILTFVMELLYKQLKSTRA